MVLRVGLLVFRMLCLSLGYIGVGVLFLFGDCVYCLLMVVGFGLLFVVWLV